MPDLKNLFIRYRHVVVPEMGSGPLGYWEKPDAVLIFEKIGEGKVRYGWSKCSPTDQFSYKRARQIALGRLVCKRAPHTMPEDIQIFFRETWPMVERWMEKKDIWHA